MDIFLRTEHNYSMFAASIDSGLACEVGSSMTKQSFKEESDINVIVRRFGLTGELPGDFRAPEYGDFSDVMDFQTAMNAVRGAQESFDSMPAALRARFDNQPQKLLEFLNDAGNRDEAVKLGLVKPVVVVAPVGTP